MPFVHVAFSNRFHPERLGLGNPCVGFGKESRLIVRAVSQIPNLGGIPVSLR